MRVGGSGEASQPVTGGAGAQYCLFSILLLWAFLQEQRKRFILSWAKNPASRVCRCYFFPSPSDRVCHA